MLSGETIIIRTHFNTQRLFTWQNAALFVFWLYLVYLLRRIVVHPGNFQWDFRVYYYAGKAFALGENPYDSQTLERMYRPILPQLSYVYPPLTLLFYKMWASLPVTVACKLWFGLKVLSLAALVLVWHRWFLPLKHNLLTLAYFAFAFNAALDIDLRSGNISVFEQLVLWTGLACLLTGRRWVFCVCIVVLTQFKLTPIAFLLLLLMTDERPQWKPFFISLAASATLLAANVVFYPLLFREWLHLPLARSDERGGINPATLALLRDGHDMLAHHGLRLPNAITAIVYLMVCTGIVWATVKAWQEYRKHSPVPDPRLRMFVFCLVYALVLPRFKGYSYILLLIPTLYLLRRQPSGLFLVWASALFLLPGMSSLPFVNYVSLTVSNYLPLLLAYTVWYFYMTELRRPLVSASAMELQSPSLSARLF